MLKQTQSCLYFSDLTDAQLTALFRECPLLRFQLCSVIVSYVNFGKNPKLFGNIQVNDTRRSLRGLSSDPATLFTFTDLFNRKYYDPIHLPDTESSISLNHDISFCSIPTSLSVQIVARLYITVDNNDMDYDDLGDDDDDDDDEVDKKKDAIRDKFDQLFKPSSRYDDLNDFGDWGLESKFAVEKDDDEEVDKEKITTEEGDGIMNQVFEVCNQYSVIDFFDSFAKTPDDGGSAFATINGEGGSLHLNYVALKYAVDASLEMEFDVATTSKETKIVGSIIASYGNDFDYGLRPKRKHLYNAMLFETKTIDDDVYVKPGKINLMRSVLAVPAPFSLIIDANLRDLTSGLEVLSGSDEFLVPCDGSDSIGSINGIDCSLKLKVHWKLPFDMTSL